MKPYVVRRAKKRRFTLIKYGRCSYCQECGKRCTASEIVIQFNVVDTARYCPACAAIVSGGPVGYYDSRTTRTGDFYH